MQENLRKPHVLTLENREKLSLGGVEDVSGFNDESVSLLTSLGELNVRGSKLHISKLDLNSGEVEIEGKINLLQYTQLKNDKGILKRLFT